MENNKSTKNPVIVPLGMVMDVIKNEIYNHAIALIRENNVPMEVLPYILEGVENNLLKNSNTSYALKYMESNNLLRDEVKNDGTSNNVQGAKPEDKPHGQVHGSGRQP